MAKKPQNKQNKRRFEPMESYEMLCVGDLVQYIDPIPEDIRIIDDVGVVIQVEGVNYMKVVWQTGAKPGLYLRRELTLLSRAKFGNRLANNSK